MPHGEAPEINPAKLKNVVPFQPEKQFKYEHHEASTQVLRDLGFDNLEDAEAALESMRAEKDQTMLSFAQKIRDKIFNNSEDIQKYTALERQYGKLSKAVSLYKTTQGEQRKAA